MDFIFFPNIFPKERKINWKIETKRGKKIGLTPKVAIPIPPAKESRDKAVPKKRASFPSIVLESSKSEEMGFRIIWMVMPRGLIKNWCILEEFFFWILEDFLWGNIPW